MNFFNNFTHKNFECERMMNYITIFESFNLYSILNLEAVLQKQLDI